MSAWYDEAALFFAWCETEAMIAREACDAEADIVVQNQRPGLLQRFGLDGKSLRSSKPSLIYCNIGAFGAEGPLRSKPGYDPLMQAFSGIMSITGEEGREPVRV